MRFLRFVAVVAVAVAVIAVVLAIRHGSDDSLAPEECSASVGGQEVVLGIGQGRVASLIAAIGVRRGLPARAVSIALAAAMQESKLRNLGGGDRDSVGIFQQRPSQGWGTRAQIRDPSYAVNAFYDALQRIPGYQTMRITEAAQRVQRSGFPEAYEVHAAGARALASALTGYSGGGRFSCVVHQRDESGTAAAVSRSLHAFGALHVTRGPRQDLDVAVAAGPAGRRTGWAVAQYVVAHARALHVRAVSYDGRTWKVGRPSEKGWTRASAPVTRVRVSLG